MSILLTLSKNLPDNKESIDLYIIIIVIILFVILSVTVFRITVDDPYNKTLSRYKNLIDRERYLWSGHWLQSDGSVYKIEIKGDKVVSVRNFGNEYSIVSFKEMESIFYGNDLLNSFLNEKDPKDLTEEQIVLLKKAGYKLRVQKNDG